LTTGFEKEKKKGKKGKKGKKKELHLQTLAWTVWVHTYLYHPQPKDRTLSSCDIVV
jgi:hypothetical protein